MSKITAKKFLNGLANAHTEEEILTQYQSIQEIDEWPRPFGSDGLQGGTLWEFKHGLVANNCHLVLAQACYYLQRIRTLGVYKGTHYPMPKRVVCADEEAVCVMDAADLDPFTHENYDWSRAASSPDPALVLEMHRLRPLIIEIKTEQSVQDFLSRLKSVGSPVKQVITRNNFEHVFRVWERLFGKDLDTQSAANAFIIDLCQEGVFVDSSRGRVLLRSDVGEEYTLHVSVPQYEEFWSCYEIPPDNEEVSHIIARKDRMVAIQHRREAGEFFTNLDLAKKGHDYLVDAFGEEIYEGNWWNMAAGTGNLVYHCPPMPGRLFVSTLNKEDVQTIKASGQNPEAEVFAYDFLNQRDDELPEKLRKALQGGGPWTVLINPPYAAGTDMIASFGQEGAVKTGTSKTFVGNRMREDNLGHACQNVYSQFLYRVLQLSREYNLDLKLGVFSKGLWLSSTGFKKFREQWYNYFELCNGFCIHCGIFHQATGNWPVTYTTWRLKQ